jgi:hypothetical protein
LHPVDDPNPDHVTRIARTVRDVSKKLPGFAVADHWDISHETTWTCRVLLTSLKPVGLVEEEDGRVFQTELTALGRIDIALDSERIYIELGVGPGYQTLAGGGEPAYTYDTTIYLEDHSIHPAAEAVAAAMHMLYGLVNYHQKASLEARLRDREGKFIS